MTDIKLKKETVKLHLTDLRNNLKEMHLAVSEQLLLPQPDEVKTLMNKVDQLLKLIEWNHLLLNNFEIRKKMKIIKQFLQIIFI